MYIGVALTHGVDDNSLAPAEEVTSQLEHLQEGKVCVQSQGLEGPQGRALPEQPPK